MGWLVHAATEGRDVSSAVVVYREDGRWQAGPLPGAVGADLEGLVEAVRRQPGDVGSLALVDVAHEFFVAVRVAMGRERLLLSDAGAAGAWDLAGQVLDRLDVPPPDDDRDVVPAGDLGIFDDLGVEPASWRWCWETSTPTPTSCSARSPRGWGSARSTSGYSTRSQTDAPQEPSVSYFAAALARTAGGWSAAEVDLDEVEDLDALTDLLREQVGDGEGPGLLLFEEDDEYVAVVRVDGGAGSLREPRVFLSDRRAVQSSGLADMLWEDAGLADEVTDEDDDDDEGIRPVAEPVGDPALLGDLGTSADDLLQLCAGEGMLPADVLTAVSERAGCLDALESVREG